MSTRIETTVGQLPAERRRPDWRQKLVDAERGMSTGLRMDATLFGHVFVAITLLAGGVVLNLSLTQWSVLVLALTQVLAAELFHQFVKTVWNTLGHQLPPAAQNAVRIGTAGVVLTSCGAALVVLLIFGQRIAFLLEM